MGGYTLEDKEIKLDKDVEDLLTWVEENMTAWLLTKEKGDEFVETVNRYRVPLEVVYAHLRFLTLSLEEALLAGGKEEQLMNKKEMERMNKAIEKTMLVKNDFDKESRDMLTSLLFKLVGSVEQREKEAQNAYR